MGRIQLERTDWRRLVSVFAAILYVEESVVMVQYLRMLVVAPPLDIRLMRPKLRMSYKWSFQNASLRPSVRSLSIVSHFGQELYRDCVLSRCLIFVEILGCLVDFCWCDYRSEVVVLFERDLGGDVVQIFV